MARVLIATQPWGVVIQQFGTGALRSGSGITVTINGTVYSAASGGSVVSPLVTNADGEIPGYIESGSYTLTVGAETFAVEAINANEVLTGLAAGATDAEVTAAVAAEATTRATADTALDVRLDVLETIFNVAAYGIVPGGADQSSGWATLAAAVTAAGGGTIVFGYGTYRINTFTIPNSGATYNPTQVPIRITGQGNWSSGRNTSPSGGTIIDLGGSTAPAKIDTRGQGVLMLDHLTFREPNASTTTPFLQTTNTTVMIERCAFIGHSSKSGITCDQDAILLGGGDNVNATGGPAGSGGGIDSDAAFQGYVSSVKDCAFHRIRRGVYGKRWCNASIIRDNWFMHSCGTNLGTGAAIELAGFTGDTCAGNQIVGNQIECIGYVYGVKLTNATNNTLGPNGFYDETGGLLAAYYRFETGAEYNAVVDGFRDDSFALISEHATVTGTNSVVTSHQSQESIFQYLKAKRLVTGTQGEETVFGGGSNSTSVRPAAAQSNSAISIFRVQRSAAEGVSPSQVLFEILNGNGLVLTDVLATPGAASAGTGRLYSTASGLLRHKGPDGNVHHVSNQLTGTATWDPASLADGASTSTTVTVTGAAVGDCVTATHNQITNAHMTTGAGVDVKAHVTSADTVTITITNRTGGALDLATGTVRACVFEF